MNQPQLSSELLNFYLKPHGGFKAGSMLNLATVANNYKIR